VNQRQQTLLARFRRTQVLISKLGSQIVCAVALNSWQISSYL
jgi:hypothetical protein